MYDHEVVEWESGNELDYTGCIMLCKCPQPSLKFHCQHHYYELNMGKEVIGFQLVQWDSLGSAM